MAGQSASTSLTTLFFGFFLGLIGAAGAVVLVGGEDRLIGLFDPNRSPVPPRVTEAVATIDEAPPATDTPETTLTIEGAVPADSGGRAGVRDMSPSHLDGELVSFDGRLSVNAQDVRLGRVVDEITSLAPVAIILDPALADRRVQVQFTDRPLGEGLRTLLREFDIFLYHGAGLPVQAVWVYPRHEGQGLRPVPPSEWASTRELEWDLSSADPRERASAVLTLAERAGAEAEGAVLRGLEDTDARVRTAAMYGSLGTDIELPAAKLSELALNDSSEDVRFLAIEALAAAEAAGLANILSRAKEDPSARIRSHVRQILGEAGGPRATDQSEARNYE